MWFVFGPDLGKRYLSQHLIRKRNKFPDQMLEKWRRTYQLNARFAEAEIASKDRTNHLWIWGKLDKRMMGVMTMLMHQNSQLCRNMERGKRLSGYTRRCQKSLQSVLEDKVNARRYQQLQRKYVSQWIFHKLCISIESPTRIIRKKSWGWAVPSSAPTLLSVA